MSRTAPVSGHRHVTISDIARAAGVSKSTVSYALNGKPGVGESMRRRIVELARTMGFRPSSAATALSNARASAVGMVTYSPEMTTLGFNLFFPNFLAGMEEELGRRDVALLIRTVPDVAHELAVYERWASDGRVDGVVLKDQLVHDPRPAALRRLGLPAVIAGQRSAEGIPAVRADDAEAAATAVRYLAGLGHRRIARVAGVQEHLHTHIRGAAFRRAMAALALDATTVNDAATDYAAATRRLLALRPAPTAILYESANAAIEGMRAATALGVAIPGQLSIIAWDDSPVCKLVSPPLTALHRDVVRFGEQCARRLLVEIGEELDAPDDAAPAMLTELRERGSTAGAAR
jgi:DNA-binding LacI/PurR family transcriptional regulator